MRATAIVGMVLLTCSGCAIETGDTESAPTADEVKEAVSTQDVPTTLPYSADFSITVSSSLAGRPFHVNGGATVTIAAEARWANAVCKVPYTVSLREYGMFGTTLKEYIYPVGGVIHTEHWKVPSAGMYRMQITIGSQKPCLPFKGHATITSP
jgi:hypothetical protein